LLNYNEYQDNNHQSNQQVTSNQPTSNQQVTTNKNDNNNKNEKNDNNILVAPKVATLESYIKKEFSLEFIANVYDKY
jgi:hypothetical protein